MPRRVAALLCLLLLAVAGGCGGRGEERGARAGAPDLTVSAASSLKTAFTAYGRGFEPAQTRFSFAGSDELAAQIRQGVRPDVFASATPKLPEQLRAEGLVEAPVTFAANRLVLAVPAQDARVRTLADAARPGTKLALGSPSVPVGAYTRSVLARLPRGEREGILVNVRSQEPDVAGVAGKVLQGAVDGGFVYVTDVRAADGRLRAIDLPAALQPRVAYAAAVVRGARHPAQARAFVAGLLRGPGPRALAAAGFEPPPTR